MNIEACYYLGYTSKIHGKDGEIIIKPDVDNPEEYKNLESVLIQASKQDKTLIPFFLSNSQVLNNGTLRIKIEDIDSVGEAKPYIGKSVYLPLNSLPELTGTKFYFHEIIDFTITDTRLGDVGKIKQVLEYPTQAIFEIVNSDGKEILIPITDDIVIEVDRANKKILVTSPEGLIELYLE